MLICCFEALFWADLVKKPMYGSAERSVGWPFPAIGPARFLPKSTKKIGA